MPSSIDLQHVFLEQAQSLVAGGELLPGGVEALAKKLHTSASKQTPLKVKLGLDPTRPDLHLGHTVVLRKLRAFQDLGHEAILIIGDATALIGDPSGRNQTRPPLSEEEVRQNADTYLAQAEKIIDIRKAKIVRNSNWLSLMNLQAFLQLASKVTVAQILAREDFSNRYKQGVPIAIHELFYPLMQAYDSVMIDADIELGGTDQRFNNLLGRELQLAFQQAEPQKYLPKSPQLVLLMPLLEGTDGKVKMSKSYPEHCINITDAPENMYGKLMSIPDELITRYELLLTPARPEQVADHEALLKKPSAEGGLNPRDLKAYLAKWLVSIYSSQEQAEEAEQSFNRRFRERELPEKIAEVTLPCNLPFQLTALMVEQQLAPSKSEARRLIQGGGVKLLVNSTTLKEAEKISDPEASLSFPSGHFIILQVGKRKFLKIMF